jgi:hypothetical protein
MTEIEWAITIEDDADFVGGTGKHATLLQGGWPGVAIHCSEAARQVAEDYFDTLDRRWDHWFGDSPEAAVRMRIYSPEAIAGDYLVDIRLVTKARARKLEVHPK